MSSHFLAFVLGLISIHFLGRLGNKLVRKGKLERKRNLSSNLVIRYFSKDRNHETRVPGGTRVFFFLMIGFNNLKSNLYFEPWNAQQVTLVCYHYFCLLLPVDPTGECVVNYSNFVNDLRVAFNSHCFFDN